MAGYEVRENRYYTTGDTWVYRTEEGAIRIGITDYAQKKLKEIEYLNLAEPEEEIVQMESLGEIESKKAVSEMMSPVSGTICCLHEEVVDQPGMINRDPYEKGWILEVNCEDFEEQIRELMSAAEYEAYIAGR